MLGSEILTLRFNMPRTYSNSSLEDTIHSHHSSMMKTISSEVDLAWEWAWVDSEEWDQNKRVQVAEDNSNSNNKEGMSLGSQISVDSEVSEVSDKEWVDSEASEA